MQAMNPRITKIAEAARCQDVPFASRVWQAVELRRDRMLDRFVEEIKDSERPWVRRGDMQRLIGQLSDHMKAHNRVWAKMALQHIRNNT